MISETTTVALTKKPKTKFLRDVIYDPETKKFFAENLDPPFTDINVSNDGCNWKQFRTDKNIVFNSLIEALNVVEFTVSENELLQEIQRINKWEDGDVYSGCLTQRSKVYLHITRCDAQGSVLSTLSFEVSKFDDVKMWWDVITKTRFDKFTCTNIGVAVSYRTVPVDQKFTFLIYQELEQMFFNFLLSCVSDLEKINKKRILYNDNLFIKNKKLKRKIKKLKKENYDNIS